MHPPIFEVCSADAGVKAVLGTPCRLYPFGLAPQNPVKPYAVWQTVGGSPENYLAGRPDTERHALQIDVYASSASQARAALVAIERAVELSCYVTRYGGESRDMETKNYRSSMDVDWHTYR